MERYDGVVRAEEQEHKCTCGRKIEPATHRMPMACDICGSRLCTECISNPGIKPSCFSCLRMTQRRAA